MEPWDLDFRIPRGRIIGFTQFTSKHRDFKITEKDFKTPFFDVFMIHQTFTVSKSLVYFYHFVYISLVIHNLYRYSIFVVVEKIGLHLHFRRIKIKIE